jgi:hypothetical protein
MDKVLANRRKNKENYRNYKLKYTFGITREDYDSLLKSQEKKCAVGKTHYSNLKRVLSVDHNHKTGKIRGLLCSSCNLALGHVKDSMDLLESLKQYLKKYEDA